MTLVDQGDGTFAPKISGQAATAAGGAPLDATYITKTANASLTAETAIGAGTAGQILQSDGTNPVYTDKSVSDAQTTFTDVTTGDATTTKHGYLKKLGAAAKILQSDGTAQQWVTEPAADLVAAAGDLLVGTAVDTLGRVAIGAANKILTSDGTNPAWGNGALTTAGDLEYGGAAGIPTRLAAGTAAYGLISQGVGSAPVWAEILPWHIWIIPMMTTPDATTGTWVTTGGDSDSGVTYLFYTPGSAANSGATNRMYNSTLAQNDAWAIDLVLAQGTWDANLWVAKGPANGIITLNQDGSSMGTVDTYAAAAAAAKVSITGWTVAATGKKRMQLKMATKNASSSNYILSVQGIEFRRTA